MPAAANAPFPKSKYSVISHATYCNVCGEPLSGNLNRQGYRSGTLAAPKAGRNETIKDGLSEPAPVPEGTPIAHWIIRRRIGKGAMGVVYEAHHQDLNAAVAI